MHIIAETALASLLRAETYSQVHEVIVELADGLGFSTLGYQYWPGGPAYGDENFSGVVQSNYPDSWLKRYVEMNYYEDDPVRLYGLKHEGVIEWQLIPRWTSRQEQVMQDAARHGLEEGIVTSLRDSSGGRNQIAFAGKAAQGDIRLALEIVPTIVPTMAVCFRRAHKLEEKLRCLSVRQRDVFLLLREGKVRDEIAQNLSISLRQVDRHISQLKSKTGTTKISIGR